MRLANIAALVGGILTTLSASAKIVNFTYTQNDSTGSGSIAPFTLNPDGQGDISFSATPLPAAAVANPNPGLTPAGFIGAQNVAAGNSNEGNVVTGLTWSGFVTANGTRGSENWTIKIPLRFVPKQTQTPDANDYNWNIVFGDSPANGDDMVTSVNIRTAMWLSRDNIPDTLETPNTFQRYTQENNKVFVVGQDTFSNLDTTTTAIKDATDAGDPQGTDAAARDLAFYFGWRDQGTVTSGALLIDTFTVGGLLNAEEGTLAPEPSSAVLVLVGGLLMGRRRS
jgi:hypothetical protein